MAQSTIHAVYLGENHEIQKHILRGCGQSVSLQALSAAAEVVKALESRCIDIVCLDHNYSETLRLIRQFPLARLTKFYFVIAVAANEVSCRRLGNRGVQYLTTYQTASIEVPEMLKSCIALIRLEQREKPRTAMHLPAMIRAGRGTYSPAIITDISESGCRISTAQLLASDSEVSLRFQIGDTDLHLDASAKVVWTDSVGQAGLVFSYIYPAQFLRLRAWLSRRYGRIFLPMAEPIQGMATAAC